MKRGSRQNYRRSNPSPPKVTGAVQGGEMKECWRQGMDDPITLRVFTMRESAEALGRTVLTFKKWVDEGIMPEPILTDVVKNYRHYSAGELEAIADVLRVHEQEFRYLSVNHSHIIHAIWQRVEGYRHENV